MGITVKPKTSFAEIIKQNATEMYKEIEWKYFMKIEDAPSLALDNGQRNHI